MPSATAALALTQQSRGQVPTQIELLLGSCAQPGSDASQCTWKPLGTLTYASNEKSGFQARELKSATFPAEHAGFLRLVVHGAYANQYNRHGQVGPCVSWKSLSELSCGPDPGQPRLRSETFITSHPCHTAE